MTAGVALVAVAVIAFTGQSGPHPAVVADVAVPAGRDDEARALVERYRQLVGERAGNRTLPG